MSDDPRIDRVAKAISDYHDHARENADSHPHELEARKFLMMFEAANGDIARSSPRARRPAAPPPPPEEEDSGEDLGD